MGHIEVVGLDDEAAIPYDEAVIHLEGDEDSEIEIRCPGALRLAPLIVKAVNGHEALVKALEAACGYLLNAKIDLETGCTKATAIKTIEGGLNRARQALRDHAGGA
jgi:hypothetical protein